MKMVVLFLLSALLFLPSCTSAQEVDSTDNCLTDSLVISTGWNRAENRLERYSTEDYYWKVVRVNANPLPPKIAPWPAVFSRGGDRDASNQWIRAFSPAETPDTLNGTYTFETSFCLTDIADHAFLSCRLGLVSGVYTRLSLNGVWIYESPLNGIDPRERNRIEIDITPYIRPGLNSIQVETEVSEERVLGFALTGYVTARNEENEKLFSCDGCGQLPPRKNQW